MTGLMTLSLCLSACAEGIDSSDEAAGAASADPCTRYVTTQSTAQLFSTKYDFQSKKLGSSKAQPFGDLDSAFYYFGYVSGNKYFEESFEAAGKAASELKNCPSRKIILDNISYKRGVKVPTYTYEADVSITEGTIDIRSSSTATATKPIVEITKDNVISPYKLGGLAFVGLHLRLGDKVFATGASNKASVSVEDSIIEDTTPQIGSQEACLIVGDETTLNVKNSKFIGCNRAIEYRDNALVEVENLRFEQTGCGIWSAAGSTKDVYVTQKNEPKKFSVSPSSVGNAICVLGLTQQS